MTTTTQSNLKVTRIKRKCDFCGKEIKPRMKYGKTKKVGYIFCEVCSNGMEVLR